MTMASRIDDLVQRQAAILVEIAAMDDFELTSLANPSPLGSAVSEAHTNARKLLRGVARRPVLEKASFSSAALTNTQTIIPAQPGFFVINVMPLSDGSFDREHVLQEPVVAWQVECGNYVRPLIIGMQTGDRWAV